MKESVFDSEGNWIEDTKTGVFDSDDPEGPFTCTSCGNEFENVPVSMTIKEALELLSLRAIKLRSADFAQEVVETYLQKASNLNLGGKEAQLKFLLENCGFETVFEMIQRKLKLALEKV